MPPYYNTNNTEKYKDTIAIAMVFDKFFINYLHTKLPESLVIKT